MSFSYTNYRGKNHRKPCAQNHGSKPMDCACHKQNRVPKTMVLKPMVLCMSQHEKSYKNPKRVCVKGGSICDITITNHHQYNCILVYLLLINILLKCTKSLILSSVALFPQSSTAILTGVLPNPRPQWSLE